MNGGENDLERDPKQTETGNEHMTDAQRVELELLSRQVGEPTPSEGLTRAEASEKIEELRLQVDEESNMGFSKDDTDTVIRDDES
jgi:hypothetical protein